MTFVLSEISNDGIYMSADSSEIQIPEDESEIKSKKVQKIEYLPDLSLGVSTWGDWTDEFYDMNTFIKTAAAEYMDHRSKGESNLLGFSNYLADRLDIQFEYDGIKENTDLYTGFHFCGYAYPSKYERPGLCNVFIEKHYNHFEAQKTCPVCDAGSRVQLTNGIYRPFVQARPLINEFERVVDSILKDEHSEDSDPDLDSVRVRAEWLGNLVRQMCIGVKKAGLRPIIGDPVTVLYFNSSIDSVRWFHLPGMLNGLPEYS